MMCGPSSTTTPERAKWFPCGGPNSDEDPFIRQKFEDELAKHGLESLMVKEVYEEWETTGTTTNASQGSPWTRVGLFYTLACSCR